MYETHQWIRWQVPSLCHEDLVNKVMKTNKLWKENTKKGKVKGTTTKNKTGKNEREGSMKEGSMNESKE